MAQSTIDLDPATSLRRRDFLCLGAGLALAPSVAWAGRERCADLAIAYCHGTPPAAGEVAADEPRTVGMRPFVSRGWKLAPLPGDNYTAASRSSDKAAVSPHSSPWTAGPSGPVARSFRRRMAPPLA